MTRTKGRAGKGNAARRGDSVMARAIAVFLAPASADSPLQPFLQTLRRAWSDLMRDAIRPYRPEQHYMRGPGPAWRAKHGLQ